MTNPRQGVEKQRHCSANRGPYSQGCGLPSGYVWLWEKDHNEGGAPTNWCLWTAVLEKTPENPLDGKKTRPENPKGNQPWTCWKDRCWSWNSSILVNWYKKLTHWKVPDAGKDEGRRRRHPRARCRARHLECKVKWALGSITMNKANGGDGIPAELFKVLKDNAVKVLHSICQQIWKTQQWPQDWKRSVFIPIPKKGNTKEYISYHTIALISHASSKFSKQGFNSIWTVNFCFIDYAKAFDCVDHSKLWIILKRDGDTRPPDLSFEKPVCRSRSNS